MAVINSKREPRQAFGSFRSPDKQSRAAHHPKVNQNHEGFPGFGDGLLESPGTLQSPWQLKYVDDRGSGMEIQRQYFLGL